MILENVTCNPFKHKKDYIILIVAVSSENPLNDKGLIHISVFVYRSRSILILCNWPDVLCTLLCGSHIKRKDLTTCILHSWVESGLQRG